MGPLQPVKLTNPAGTKKQIGQRLPGNGTCREPRNSTLAPPTLSALQPTLIRSAHEAITVHVETSRRESTHLP